ncbi:hypothetical protein OIU84_008091 [Salix udensis]|uniref:Uncharacterized protein n=1 Tax=Salix udensis TaxID=889485 RepID=A0AAD6P0C7_9ROSI|nr:hypothetical protein OIU84_008091 [Salix udensis]
MNVLVDGKHSEFDDKHSKVWFPTIKTFDGDKGHMSSADYEILRFEDGDYEDRSSDISMVFLRSEQILDDATNQSTKLSRDVRK